MKLKLLPVIIAVFAAALGATSCKDSNNYADLLVREDQYVNNYLADHRVSNTIPTDTNFVFETGPNAPYYRLDEDGFMYMQVINPGTKGNYAKENEVYYFRFTRYNLQLYKDKTLPEGAGNETDMSYINAWFRYNNYSLESTYQWGQGIQKPLEFLPVDCEVRIVIKSQMGFYSEIQYVTPYLFTLRYYPQLT